jgi:nitroreductase
MDVKQAIAERKSIRKYHAKEIPVSMILELIDAARLAPSGNNSQPSRYFVITDKETKEKLKKNKIFEQEFVYSAPLIIVCSTNPEAYKKRLAEWDSQNELRAVRDLSIASSFLVLRATELNLGTCYVGWIQKEKIKEVLDIPKEYIVPYVITIGYPAEKPKQRSRKGIEDVIINKIK